MTTATDPLAATCAERDLADNMAQNTEAVAAHGVNIDYRTCQELANGVVAEFGVTFERENGLRRLVLVGEWEVDPAAVQQRRHASSAA